MGDDLWIVVGNRIDLIDLVSVYNNQSGPFAILTRNQNILNESPMNLVLFQFLVVLPTLGMKMDLLAMPSSVTVFPGVFKWMP